MNQMKKVQTIYIIGNLDRREDFFLAESSLIDGGYKVLNPIRIQQEYEERFGEMSQKQWQKKFLGYLLRADGVAIIPGLTDTDCPQVAKELKVAICNEKEIIMTPLFKEVSFKEVSAIELSVFLNQTQGEQHERD